MSPFPHTSDVIFISIGVPATWACRYDPNMSPLEKTAHSIHGESLTPGRSTRAFNSETIAVGVLVGADGETQTVASSSRGKMSPAQRAKAEFLGATPLQMANVSGPGGHADVNIIKRYAEKNNMTVREIAASRPICPTCEETIMGHGATPASPLKRKKG